MMALRLQKVSKNPYNQNTTQTPNIAQNRKNRKSIRLVISKT